MKLTHKGARQFDKAATEQLLSGVEDEMMKTWWDSASEWSKVCMPLLCACCVHVVCMLCARGYYTCGLTACSQAWKMASTQVQALCRQLSRYLDRVEASESQTCTYKHRNNPRAPLARGRGYDSYPVVPPTRLGSSIPVELEATRAVLEAVEDYEAVHLISVDRG